MGDSELAADVTGPHSLMGHLDNPLSDNVGERPAVDENTTELVNSTVTCK